MCFERTYKYKKNLGKTNSKNHGFFLLRSENFFHCFILTDENSLGFLFLSSLPLLLSTLLFFFFLFILVTVYCCLFAISDSLYTECNGSEFKSIIVFDSAAQLNPKQKHVKRSQNLSQ